MFAGREVWPGTGSPRLVEILASFPARGEIQISGFFQYTRGRWMPREAEARGRGLNRRHKKTLNLAIQGFGIWCQRRNRTVGYRSRFIRFWRWSICKSTHKSTLFLKCDPSLNPHTTAETVLISSTDARRVVIPFKSPDWLAPHFCGGCGVSARCGISTTLRRSCQHHLGPG